MEKILSNKAKCNVCGDIIESKHVHDYVRCSCGATAVDGGLEYIRRTYKFEGCYTELSETVEVDEI